MNPPDWHLQEWLAHAGKRQSSLVNELGWTKGRANYIFHGRAPYHRDVVNEIARWLKIEPYELLMRPSEASALRRLRETAALIVAEDPATFEPARKSPQGRPRVKSAPVESSLERSRR